MEPGREMDALIAHYIFGWNILTDGRMESKEKLIRPVPEYSTDHSAAWEVVEKMRNNKVYLDIRVWPDEYQVLPHQDENNKLIDRWIVKKQSLPEAIGKAALLAVLNL